MCACVHVYLQERNLSSNFGQTPVSISKGSERLDAVKLRGVKVEGFSTLPRELLGMYSVYLLPPHDESLNPNREHSFSCTENMALESAVKPTGTRATISGLS